MLAFRTPVCGLCLHLLENTLKFALKRNSKEILIINLGGQSHLGCLSSLSNVSVLSCKLLLRVSEQKTVAWHVWVLLLSSVDVQGTLIYKFPLTRQRGILIFPKLSVQIMPSLYLCPSLKGFKITSVKHIKRFSRTCGEPPCCKVKVTFRPQCVQALTSEMLSSLRHRTQIKVRHGQTTVSFGNLRSVLVRYR